MTTPAGSATAPDFASADLETIADWLRSADHQAVGAAVGAGHLTVRLTKEKQELGWGKKIIDLIIDDQGKKAVAVLNGLQRILQRLEKANQNTEVDDPAGTGARIIQNIDQVQIDLGEFITDNDLWQFPVGDDLRVQDRLAGKQAGICNVIVAKQFLDGLKSSREDIMLNDDFEDGNELIIVLRRLKELALLPS